MKNEMIWNDGKSESGKMVKVLSVVALEKRGLENLEENANAVAVAVPFGESWKIYDMKNGGKIVRCGTAKTWASLNAAKAHFEAK